MIEAFLHGTLLAFGLIIPLGVQNVFVFNQGATQPRIIQAFPSIITAALCDTILILLAILGLSLVMLEMAWLKTIIFLIGFLFLMYMGWVTWHTHSNAMNKNFEPLSAKRQIAFAMSVSLLNPHAILDTVAVIGTNSLHYTGKEQLAYTSSCILVSWLWFVGIALAGRSVHKLDQNGVYIRAVNKASAIIIWMVALYIGWQLLLQ